MQLSYRGIRYEANLGNVSTSETQMTATYRGIAYQICQTLEIIPQPTVQLIYRGVPYRTTSEKISYEIPYQAKDYLSQFT